MDSDDVCSPWKDTNLDKAKGGKGLYFNNIIKELKVEDRVGIRETCAVSYIITL